jgi:AmiR/NasT family two-component response regulator
MKVKKHRPPRLLVADDDRIILLTLAEGLAEAGFEILQAKDGLRALEICKDQAPDLALLDIRMPGLNGLELAARLAAETTVPFLFFSAYADEELLHQAIEAGALGYLIKPMKVAAIVPTLKAALARAGDIASLRTRQTSIDNTLVNNRLIATAVGMTMRDMRLSRTEAFEYLRANARRQQIKLTDLAEELLAEFHQGDNANDAPPQSIGNVKGR